MTVLMIGRGDERDLILLSDEIERLGHRTINCDVLDWPSEAPITLSPRHDGAVFNSSIEYENISGAYVIPHHVFHPCDPRFNDQLENEFIPVLNQLRELRAMFESLCRILEWRGANVLSPLRTHYWHDRKPWQLHLYEAIDIPVPDTIFTNEPEEVRTFYEEHDSIIYKPITRGGAPRMLSDGDLTENRLKKLATAPVQFQEFVEGEDIRVYVLDGEIIGAIRYESENFSFKVDMNKGREDSVVVHDATVSNSVTETVARTFEHSGLTFAAADIRRRPDGTHVLLELNDAPRFAAADLEANQHIAEELANFLSK